MWDLKGSLTILFFTFEKMAARNGSKTWPRSCLMVQSWINSWCWDSVLWFYHKTIFTLRILSSYCTTVQNKNNVLGLQGTSSSNFLQVHYYIIARHWRRFSCWSYPWTYFLTHRVSLGRNIVISVFWIKTAVIWLPHRLQNSDKLTVPTKQKGSKRGPLRNQTYLLAKIRINYESKVLKSCELTIQINCSLPPP